MSDKSGFNGGQILFAFLGGAAAGAVVALLTAKQSGAKTRAEIRHRARVSYNDAARLPKSMRGALGAARDAFNESISANGAG